ncbi:transcriptional antiterminator [Alicyclobacillus contaminans]|uniref:BglG family transcription antiterminator n=1 Tax=Alicyclobacillus contaminans TaxID=392016 RepID=UPI00047BFF2D|nr:PRD domain-containing protein [Alicyclobacillus contaminans]GMA48952.1 transcriptional antiterminator [Alicyclobacillus contaminans]
MLASRPREILRTLVASTHPVTVQELANRFRVSSRTVKYDLESIRDFLKTRGIELHSRPNIGLWLGDRQHSRDILGELLIDAGRYESVLSRSERISYIVAWLLLREEYVTFGELAEELLVSRNTVIMDIKYVEQALAKWDVYLERRIRYGIRVTAPELQRRRAAEYTAREFLNGTDMFQIIQNVLSNGDDRLDVTRLGNLFLLPSEDVKLILQAMAGFVQSAKSHGLYLADRDIIGVFIRICIAVSRSRHTTSQGLNFTDDVVSTAEGMAFARPVRDTLDVLSGRLSIRFLDADPVYVCLYFGTGVSEPTSALTVTRRLIETVSRRMGVPFQTDPDLFDNLMAHLGSRLPKLRNGVPAPNPLTSEIIRNYADLFNSVKLACKDVFARDGIDLEDSDVAFLVLHFAATLERMVGEKDYRALVVCSTGRGNARFLKSFFENEVRHLEVVSCCSIREVESALENNPVDLVITTLSVQNLGDVPVVRVGHLPTRDDVASVYAKLSQLKSHREMYRSNSYQEKPSGHRDKGPRGTGLNANLPKDVLQSLEHFNHDIITRGFELSHLVIERFRDYLTDESAIGLTLHILLMVNRLAFSDPYRYQNLSPPWEDASPSLRDGLKELMRERNIDIPESEVDAILRYFSEA